MLSHGRRGHKPMSPQSRLELKFAAPSAENTNVSPIRHNRGCNRHRRQTAQTGHQAGRCHTARRGFGSRCRLEHERLQHSRAIRFQSVVTGRPCGGGHIHPYVGKEPQHMRTLSSPLWVWPCRNFKHDAPERPHVHRRVNLDLGASPAQIDRTVLQRVDFVWRHPAAVDDPAVAGVGAAYSKSAIKKVCAELPPCTSTFSGFKSMCTICRA